MKLTDYLPTQPRRSGYSHRYLIQNPADGEWLPVTLHADAKTSPSVMYESNGRATATIGNAWALPAGPPETGGSCSSTTPACVSCYAASIEARYTHVTRMVTENLASLRTVAATGQANLTSWLVALVEVSVAEQHAQGVTIPTFRWHSDGDVGALTGTGIDRRIYPRAIRAAARRTPHVQHWIYTREFWALPHLKCAPNLRVLASIDEYNLHTGCTIARQHRIPVALLANDEAHAAQLWRQIHAIYPQNAIPLACPATSRWKHDNTGPAHIVGPNGRRNTLTKGQPAVGACVSCQACLPGGRPRNITFHMHNPGTRLPAAIRRRIEVTAQ